jgi:Na+-driven multidrug efflux pump
MLAMGNAMSTFTAQNIGAGKLERVKEGYKMSYVIVLTTGLFLCIMYQLFGDFFISLFLEDTSGEAYAVGIEFITFLSFFYSFIGLKQSVDGLLRGAGDVAAFTTANLVNLSIRVIVTNVFAPIYGIQVAWMAVPMGWAANYIISFSWYLTGKWKRIKVIKK